MISHLPFSLAQDILLQGKHTYCIREGKTYTFLTLSGVLQIPMTIHAKLPTLLPTDRL